MLTIRHRIAHWLGCNRGRVYAWTDLTGRHMIALRCSGCGRLQQIAPIYGRPLRPIT